MPAFSPFRGLRYDVTRLGVALDTLVTPPYDVIDAGQQAGLEARHENNAVHLILPREAGRLDAYQQAARLLDRWRSDGTLVHDPTPRLYRYRMEYRVVDGSPRHTLGVIGALGLAEFSEGTIIPHEQTLPKAKTDRLNLIRATRANLEPIWGLTLAHGFTELAEGTGAAIADCVDAGGACHSISPIDDPEQIEALRAAVASAPLVIADGHHRYETSLAYRREIAALGGHPSAADAIMCLVVELDADELWVQPIHRTIHRTGTGTGDLRDRLRASGFDVIAVPGPATPATIDALAIEMRRRRALGLVDAAGAALLVPGDGARDALERWPASVRDVDAALFESTVVPALDPGESVGYRNDAHELAASVARGEIDAAFLLSPVTVETIEAVAAAGERMPQKTTYFAPKPCTGLVMRTLD